VKFANVLLGLKHVEVAVIAQNVQSVENAANIVNLIADAEQ
jgi:hypothetical protein